MHDSFGGPIREPTPGTINFGPPTAPIDDSYTVEAVDIR